MGHAETAAGQPTQEAPLSARNLVHIPDELVLRARRVLEAPGWGGSADPDERARAKEILATARAQRTRPFRPYASGDWTRHS